MGSFSKAFKRIQKSIHGATGGTKLFAEAHRGINKIGFKDSDAGKRGKLTGSSIGSALFAGGLNRGTLHSLTTFAEDPTNLKSMESSSRTALQANRSSAYTANLGHQLIKAVEDYPRGDEGPTPPPVQQGPGVGSGTNEAMSAARRRGLAAAFARRRASQTVTTTPLGATDKAATSKKRLLGE